MFPTIPCTITVAVNGFLSAVISHDCRVDYRCEATLVGCGVCFRVSRRGISKMLDGLASPSAPRARKIYEPRVRVSFVPISIYTHTHTYTYYRYV